MTVGGSRLRLGVHAGYYGDPVAASTTTSDGSRGSRGSTAAGSLRSLWRSVEEAGFDWISVWDHLFDPSAGEPGACFDAVAMQAALACTTERVRCGVLVYCSAYRNPAVLANAVSTIDHLSGGRAEVGLGAGWSRAEFAAIGIPFPRFAERIELLDETVRCVRLLLSGEPVTFAGRFHRLDGARCHPRPVQTPLPLWIGGRSEAVARRAAHLADGLNLPYVPPALVAERRAQLDEWAGLEGRAAGAVRIAVNVAVALDEDDYTRQFANVGDHVRRGVVVGGPAAVADAVSALAAAGADQVNLTVRAPVPPATLDALASVAERVRGAEA